ncbi:hypothetical protein Poli38472_003415 [Pythium oligandrum]|uniref:WIBG Mago-binding domain-containing protein n=1 Tax=Pythium oligandrum TaxID=41045 RepID=A0A8K1C6S4_PYTOL|nr:hypothetical protein Poli38472_003415 [Pythium oligandrum]|eukprot:TMW57490.1 hypothetical protein Poli38472_003415 [Pythium oligandrum]
MERKTTLPLGAVRTEDGQVVIPESRRADGSVRKPIRIRQGYVPQDEVPKYKPIGQRLREQEAKKQQQVGADAVAQQLGAMTIDAKRDEKTSQESPRARAKSASEEKEQPRRQESASSGTRELKNELSNVNKLLREISKLEEIAAAMERKEEGNESKRPYHQKQKLARKDELETRRQAILQELNGNGSAKPASRDERPRDHKKEAPRRDQPCTNRQQEQRKPASSNTLRTIEL